MFVQVIRGKAKDAGIIRAQMDKWDRELKPGATGYLGSTQGVADDGTFVAVVRFESEDAARRNGDRPEQGAWWETTSKALEGVSFYDCPTVDLYQGGGSNDAGFVQVMFYKPRSVDELRAVSKEFETIGAMRPDLIGGTTAIAKDGTVIDTNYFTSEQDARQGESQPMQPETRQIMERFRDIAGEIEFVDLRDPWLYS